MRKVYRIHPAIGVARVGDSPDDYFIGPEAPGVLPSLNKPDTPSTSEGQYKDQHKRIKRQGARFRIYEYTYDAAKTLTEVREITAADAHITWAVHLVNRKGAAPNFLQSGRRNEGVSENKLVIDSKRQKISRPGQPMKRLKGFFKGVAVPLGDLLTDSAGRLIVLGGFGQSQSVPSGQRIVHFANNDGWCDDVADGPVTASLRLHGVRASIEAEPAWVIAAPPDFAPPIENVITLYDVVYNMATKLHPSLDIRDNDPISFTLHIYPILRRTSNYIWVSNLARRGHGPDTDDYFITPEQLQVLSDNNRSKHAPVWHRRHHIFEHLRRPSGGGGDMPMLNSLEAQDPVALTEFQYKLMERWAEGDFESDWSGEPPVPLVFDEIPVQDKPRALDRAALEACVGGGFFPGIEVGRIMRQKSTYDRRRPFRISTKLLPGTLTANMAVPWQADFRDCGSGWWPAQRPNQVIRDGNEPVQWVPNVWKRETMIARWSDLGFIVRKTIGGQDSFVEEERNF